MMQAIIKFRFRSPWKKISWDVQFISSSQKWESACLRLLAWFNDYKFLPVSTLSLKDNNCEKTVNYIDMVQNIFLLAVSYWSGIRLSFHYFILWWAINQFCVHFCFIFMPLIQSMIIWCHVVLYLDTILETII